MCLPDRQGSGSREDMFEMESSSSVCSEICNYYVLEGRTLVVI